MKNSKWFYDMQSKVQSYLHTQYDTDNITCNFQHIMKDVVHENFKIITDKDAFFVHVIMNNTGVIAVYEMKGIFHS